MSKDQASRDMKGETASGHPGAGVSMAAPLPPWAPKDGAPGDRVDPPASVIDEGQRAAAELELAHVLLPGERVTWACKPDPSSLWKHWVWWLFIETFQWSFIAGSCAISVSSFMVDGISGLPLAVMAAIAGLALISCRVVAAVAGNSQRLRPWFQARMLRSAWYVVTTKRVILATGKGTEFTLRQWFPNEVAGVKFTRNDDSHGAVVMALEGLPNGRNRLLAFEERLPLIPSREAGEAGVAAIRSLLATWQSSSPEVKEARANSDVQETSRKASEVAHKHLEVGEVPLWIGQPHLLPFQGPLRDGSLTGWALYGVIVMGVFAVAIWLSFTNGNKLILDSMADVRGILAGAFAGFLINSIGTIQIMKRLRHTTYAVTDRRVMVITKGKDGKDSVESFLPETLCEPELLTQPDGVGRVVFRFQTPKPKRKPRGAKLGFEAIPEAHRAARAIRELHSRTQGSGAPWVEWPPKVQ